MTAKSKWNATTSPKAPEVPPEPKHYEAHRQRVAAEGPPPPPPEPIAQASKAHVPVVVAPRVVKSAPKPSCTPSNGPTPCPYKAIGVPVPPPAKTPMRAQPLPPAGHPQVPKRTQPVAPAGPPPAAMRTQPVPPAGPPPAAKKSGPPAGPPPADAPAAKKPHGPRGRGENSSWHTAWHRAAKAGPEALALFHRVWPKPKPKAP